MVDHRKEFYDSLNEFHNAGTLNQKTSISAGNPVLDIKILHRWIFQVRKLAHQRILLSIKN